MFQDHKDLLSAFHAHGVKYLIVGGYAVSFHSQPRFTKHIDVFTKADSANAQATYAALASFGDPSTFFRFGGDPSGFDILPQIPGVDFDAAWERRVEGVIDPQSGLKAFFISKDGLIAAKLASGRTRDLADVEELRDAAATLESPSAPKKPPEPVA